MLMWGQQERTLFYDWRKLTENEKPEPSSLVGEIETVHLKCGSA